MERSRRAGCGGALLSPLPLVAEDGDVGGFDPTAVEEADDEDDKMEEEFLGTKAARASVPRNSRPDHVCEDGDGFGR
jgi:hypothetical protein